MRKISFFKVGHGGGGSGNSTSTGLAFSPHEPVKCRVEEKRQVEASGLSGGCVQNANGASKSSNGGKGSTAVRRRSFSNHISTISRSIKIRKNVSLRTTLHSFPDNDANPLPITVLKCPDYPVDEDDDSPPLKSCMKIKTLEESLEVSNSGRRARYRRAQVVTSSGNATEEEKVEIDHLDVEAGDHLPIQEDLNEETKGGVSFGTVEIREHKICLEENHATTSEACIVHDGLALTLDWSVVRTQCVDVEEFQRMKGPVKEKDDLKLSYDERYFKLIEWDISESEIRDAKEKQRKLLKSKRKGVRRIVTILRSNKS